MVREALGENLYVHVLPRNMFRSFSLICQVYYSMGQIMVPVVQAGFKTDLLLYFQRLPFVSAICWHENALSNL